MEEGKKKGKNRENVKKGKKKPVTEYSTTK